MFNCGNFPVVGPLAQVGGEEPSISILRWLFTLAVLLVGMFIVINYLKKWFRSSADEMGSATGFTLSDLRELHRTGKMTDEEFELAKAKVVEAAQAAMARAAAEKSARENRRARHTTVQVAHKPEPELIDPEGDSDAGPDKNKN